MSRPIELLIPASSLEVLKTAVIFGADAVYIGGEAFGLRAKAKNFSMEEMKEFIDLVAEGKIKPVIFEKLPMEKIRDAHEMLESSAHFGKIVIES